MARPPFLTSKNPPKKLIWLNIMLPRWTPLAHYVKQPVITKIMHCRLLCAYGDHDHAGFVHTCQGCFHCTLTSRCLMMTQFLSKRRLANSHLVPILNFYTSGSGIFCFHLSFCLQHSTKGRPCGFTVWEMNIFGLTSLDFLTLMKNKNWLVDIEDWEAVWTLIFLLRK